MDLLAWISKNRLISNEWAILGNGPSIKLFEPKEGVSTIGFNRVDLFLKEKNYYLDLYISCSDNVVNSQWGKDWRLSTLNALHRSKVALLTNQVVESLNYHELLSDELLKKIIIIDKYLIEPLLFKPSAFPYHKNMIGEHLKISKSGTSVNIAYSLLSAMKVKKIYLYGCDLGWKLSKGESNNDHNHYFSDYRAKISEPFLENIRMDFVHLNFCRQTFSNIKVVNMSNQSNITYFDRPLIKKNTQGTFPSIIHQEARRFILTIDEIKRVFKRKFIFLKHLIRKKLQ